MCCVCTRQHPLPVWSHNLSLTNLLISPPILNHFWWELYHSFLVNAFPHRDGISDQSPRYIMTAQTLNFQRHARLELGAYVQMHEEHDNSMGPRTLGAICLGPAGNQQGGHWFLSLTSGARIICHRWTSLPAP